MPQELNVSFKVTDETLKLVLMQHLEIEGCIRPEMEAFFSGMERKGRATMVHFSIKPEKLKPVTQKQL